MIRIGQLTTEGIVRDHSFYVAQSRIMRDNKHGASAIPKFYVIQITVPATIATIVSHVHSVYK